MDKLPSELIHRIFSFLEYRPLASAAEVCRNWRHLTDQALLWQRLYERRWGPTKAAAACLDMCTSPQSWKAAYAVQDRWDRIGEDMTIIREGNDYFLSQKGILLRFLGSSNKSLDQRGGAIIVKGNEETHLLKSTKFSQIGTSTPGLLDRLIQFVGDMDYEYRRAAKRLHRS